MRLWSLRRFTRAFWGGLLLRRTPFLATPLLAPSLIFQVDDVGTIALFFIIHRESLQA